MVCRSTATYISRGLLRLSRRILGAESPTWMFREKVHNVDFAKLAFLGNENP